MLIYIIPIIIIGAIGFKVARSRKFPSPEESERALEQLKEETKKWVAEGIVDQSQSERIIGRYSAFEEKRALSQKNKIVKIFSGFGAILIGAGAILFIAANWAEIPPLLVTALMIIGTVGAYFAGWWLKYEKKTSPKIGESLIFLGALLFGASLILISQKYHIRVEYSNLILFWGLAILPLVYLTKSSSLLGLGSILIFFWGASSIFLGGSFFYGLGDFSFPLSHYLSFLLIIWIIVPLTYKLKSVKIQSLNLVEITVWLGITIAALLAKSGTYLLTFCLSLSLFGGLNVFLAEIHSKSEKYRDFKDVYYRLGIILILIPTFILTFPEILKDSNLAVLFNLVLFGEIAGVIYFGIIRREESFINTGITFFALLVFARYFTLTWSLGARALTFIIGGILLIVGSYFIDKARRKILQKIRQIN